MKRFVIFLLTIFFISSYIFAKNITLTIDKNILSLGEHTVLHVKISGISPSKVPKIKNLDNFNYQYIGTSSNITIINGKINSEKEFNFLITPKKIGEFYIGPAIIEYKGDKYTSNRIKVIVRKSKTGNNLNRNKYIFVKLEADKKIVKVNEEVILTLKIFRRIDVTNLNLSIPDFKKVVVEKLGKSKTYSDIINGQQYLITEIKYAIFPTIPGKLTIDPFILKGEILQDNFDTFFKNPFSFQIPFSKSFTISSNPVTIKVRPLKQSVYAVGDYTVTEKIDKIKAKVGENINLTVTIKGKGNLQLSDSLKLKKINGLKFYYDKPDIEIYRNYSGLYSKKVEKIAIVPEQPGIYKLPQIALKFYNPELKKYETIKLPKIKLKILNGTQEKLKIVGKIKSSSQTEKYQNNIQSIYTDFVLENQNIKLNIKILIYFLPGFLIFFLIFIIRIYLQKRKTKKKNAYKIFKKKIKNVTTYQQLSDCIKEYFIIKNNLKNIGITFEEIIEILATQYSSNILQLGKEVISILEECLYANNKYNLDKLKEKTLKLMEMVESESKKSRNN